MLLTMQKNHNLPSYVAFVDLVKAYDTANHNLHNIGLPPVMAATSIKILSLSSNLS